MYLKHKAYLKFKKSLLLSAFLVGAMVTSVSAQISVGAQTGVNLNQFTMPGSTIGFNIGGYGAYQVTPYFSAKLEILYSQEGGGRQNYSLPLDDPRLAGLAGNITGLNYINPYVYFHNIQVPVLLELTMPEFAESTIMPKLLLGGSYSYTVAAQELHTTQYTFSDGTFADIPYLRENVGGDYKKNQFSAIIGMGLQFKGEQRDFSFDIRYRQGLNQVNSVKQAFSYRDGRLFTSTLSFNFSMSIFKF